MAVQTKVDLNTASREDLQKIEGIGRQLADQIIRYRNENGRFESVDELLDVPGIDPERFKQFKSQVTVGNERSGW